MRHLSYRVIFLCIFLPPVLYIFTIQGLEALVWRWWTRGLQPILVSDTTGLLQGEISIQDEIQKTIEHYLSKSNAIKWGVVPRITVRTRTGRLLYPRITPEFDHPLKPDNSLPEPHTANPLAALRVAEENLKIMEEGIILSVKVEIPRNTLLANSVLIFYILLFSSVLYRAYRAKADEAERLSLQMEEDFKTATHNLQKAQERLADLAEVERNYKREIDTLQAEVASAAEKVQMTEEHALEEIETLEDKIQGSIAARQQMEEEVLRLQEELERLESSRKSATKRQAKQIESTMKRFRTLYKNLEFCDRAVEGFLNLQGELQLKAEEFIHNIDADESRLSVKRKVFAGKGAVSVFECDFAYRGRIYWKKGKDGRTQILGIGTKNTQAKDLAYVKSLHKR
jgi:predicted  nucleic acid-binding Zn-ribbon protein